VQKGYTEVYRFTGGIPEWRYFNYPMVADEKWRAIKVRKIAPQQFAALAAGRRYFILDVRPLEFSSRNAFIRNSTHCPLVYLEKYYREIPKKCEILLVDWAMISATNAAKFLISRGYTVRGVLKGGIERWLDEGRPVEIRPEEPVPFTFTWKPQAAGCLQGP
jgi:rhodanese-related sulfurtransferase